MQRLGPVLTLAAVLGLGGCELQPRDPLTLLEPAQALPPTEGTYLNMGRTLLRSGQPDMAQDAFIRSLRLEGLSAEALTGAGLASERLGLLRDAKRFFQRAANFAPDSELAQNNLGAVLYRLGEYHAAKRAFQAAFALSSGDNRTAEHNLGLAELAIRREQSEELTLAPNPVPLQRTGTGEYILGVPKQPEQNP